MGVVEGEPTVETVRYRYRAYPDRRQQREFSRLFGCTRVVYNDAVAYARRCHVEGRGFPKDIQQVVLTQGKQTPERAWLNEAYGVCLIQAVNDAKAAYRNFFNSCTGARKGRRVGVPKFKSRRDNYDTARFTRAARFTVEPGPGSGSGAGVGWLVLPRYGRLRLAWSRDLPSEPSSVTLIREPDGRYYVSFVVTRPLKQDLNRARLRALSPDSPNGPDSSGGPDSPSGPGGVRVSGIDVGLKDFAVVLSRSTDPDEAPGEQVERVETPAFLRRRERALRRSQRNLSRKKKGSANAAKARQRVAVAHRKVRQARLDHSHQQAARLVAAHDVVVVEDLNINGIASGRAAKSAHDQALGMFLRLLAEKAHRHGVVLVKVDRYFPSTRTCSACHRLTGPHGRGELSIRTWTCGALPGRLDGCGTRHERDTNAARNILTEGLRLLGQHATVADGRSETLNACGGNRRRHADPRVDDTQIPVKQEGLQETDHAPAA